MQNENYKILVVDAQIFILHCLNQTTKKLKPARFKDSIIYEDDNYLVINKWPGISTLSDRNHEICLLDRARRYRNDVQIHRRGSRIVVGIRVREREITITNG